MSRTVPAAAAAVVLVLIGVVYTTTRTNPASNTDGVSGADDSVNTSIVDDDTSIDTTPTEVVVDTGADAAASDAATLTQSDSNDSTHTTATIAEAIDYAQSLAQTPLTDAGIYESTEQLQQDPALLAAVLDEFSQETDVERLSRLRLLLGRLTDDSLVPVAESMVFSGNPESSRAALELLRDIGPRVPAAQTVALDIMSSTQNPTTLVSATHVVLSPKTADATMRQRVVTTMTGLVQHGDASVRRASYGVLARWSNDPSVTPTLLQGLNDSDASVRRNTAYELIGYAHADSSVVEALLNTLENSTEERQVRRGAVLALKRMNLDATQQARVQSAEAELN